MTEQHDSDEHVHDFMVAGSDNWPFLRFWCPDCGTSGTVDLTPTLYGLGIQGVAVLRHGNRLNDDPRLLGKSSTLTSAPWSEDR